ncbi:MAG: pyridoxal phosphate-dependent aminotransferase [Planctomycetes bacterium]|nr:pyridoxal phosphate-dependent aminotransferase [Planctomycetota bacterium]
MKTVSRMQSVQSPIIPIVGDWIRQHPGTVSLGQGVVGYGPPSEVQAELADFMGQAGNHTYHEVSGMPCLRDRIREKLETENGIRLGVDGSDGQSAVCVTAGANMAFMNAILAITHPGDEIILLRPYYFNHEMAIRIAGCTPVVVDTDETYQPVLAWIASQVTPRTRAVVTVSPNNPTGAVYDPTVLEAVNGLCRERSLCHIHDEAYEYFTYNDVSHFSPGSIVDSGSHTISLYSLSKAYGFASWRIGYMVFPAHIERAIKKIQDTILICPPMISQVAAVGALNAGRAYCLEKQRDLQVVRSIVRQALHDIRDLCQVQPSEGAFYFFLKIDTKQPALEVAERLIREFGVAVIPGETFGMTQGCYVRVSYGPLDSQTATQGLERLVRGLRHITGRTRPL